MILIAITTLIFVGAAFFVMAFILEAQSKRMSDRFTTVASAVIEDELPDSLKASMRERLLQPMFEKLAGMAEKMTPTSAVKGSALRLERAGKPWGMTPALWSVARLLLASAGMGAGMAALNSLPLTGLLRMLSIVVPSAIGIIGPGVMLDKKIKQRQMSIRKALPDVIDLLVVSVEAGLGLDAAVQEVVNRRKGPLLDEFAQVLTEVRLGKARRTAWQESAERVDVLELKVFVSALVQAEELGASVSGVLRAQSEALRVRRSLSVREMAAVLPVKMLFPLIFFIFPSMFVVILGPGMINLVDTFGAIGF